jgi:hypothetical protein
LRREAREHTKALRAALEGTGKGIRAYDDPWALNLSAVVEKLAYRLAVFRGETNIDAEDFAALIARLGKAARKLRR